MSSDIHVEERPLGQLVGQLVRDSSQLVQQEIALAKKELAENLSDLKRASAAAAIAGLFCLLGALALTAALILGLAQVMPSWAAALVVGAALGGVGAMLFKRSQQGLKQLELVPEKTGESVRRDIQAIKEAVHEP